MPYGIFLYLCTQYRTFCNNIEPMSNENTKNREKTIVRTSFVGIAANVLLAAFKAGVGIVSHSIAVTMDAVNNLSDALSSVITIVGTKLAARKPDRKHPLGYGRVEYLSALIVSAIIMYAGITAAVESVKKIITPEKADYSLVSLIIIAVAVVVKVVLGRYVKKQGRRCDCAALEASGADALFDAILSASVLLTAIIFVTTGVSLEAYVGVIIAGFIIKSGIEMIRETLNDILGKRMDSKLAKAIKRSLAEEPEVRGAYDLFLYNYGPGKDYASVHLELSDTMTVDEIDKLSRRVERKIYDHYGVTLTGIGVYSSNCHDASALAMRQTVDSIIEPYDWALQMHGFYVDSQRKEMRFDVVLKFDTDVRQALDTLRADTLNAFPGYTIDIVPDIDISD